MTTSEKDLLGLTISGRHTHAVILRDVIDFKVWVDGVIISQLKHLLEGVIDEYEADERGEALLCKSSEILHQVTGVSGHKD